MHHNRAVAAHLVRDRMSREPVTVPPYMSLTAVASCMRDSDVGCVFVTSGDELHGLVTDRDIAVRITAEGTLAGVATALEACSGDLVTVTPGMSVCQAADLMSAHSVRRIPVVEERRLVGVLTLGDIADTPHAQEVLIALSRTEANH
ncbi:CBS domain-containing protein [Streptomyces sp. NBC_01317]|uniref:CBS domain-containing protein n=1 Tax=Streptomyces sp. NBC_01317 TaxID=2903822 RepID=UPI002E168615|nr:CBS domain-containing protein [Streptomyces sp. NBC_01317]